MQAQSLIQAFALHWYNDSFSGRQRSWSDCADAQGDLGLRCPFMPEDMFTHGAVHILKNLNIACEKFFSGLLFWVNTWGFFYLFYFFFCWGVGPGSRGCCDYFYKKHMFWYLFELPWLVQTVQMSTKIICFYKKNKKYTGFNLKTKTLLDCVLKEICAVIMSDMVIIIYFFLSWHRSRYGDEYCNSLGFFLFLHQKHWHCLVAKITN